MHPIDQNARDILNCRLDALLYVLRLNRGRVTLRDLQAIARRRGLRSGKNGREILVTIYEDMTQELET